MSDVEHSASDRLRRELARLLEWDLREPGLTRAELEQHCREAIGSSCFGVCVAGSLIANAADILGESPVQVVGAVGFPFGNTDSDVKRYETEAAIDSGAQIIEVVANPGRIRERDGASIVRELRDIVEAAEERPVGVALPAAVLELAHLEWLLPKFSDIGVRGITLMFGDREADESAQLVQKASLLAGSQMGLKAEVSASTPERIAAFLKTGAIRFGTRELSRFLALLDEARIPDESGG